MLGYLIINFNYKETDVTLSVSYTKKGPGRINQISFHPTTEQRFGAPKLSSAKIAKKQVKHMVGLKNSAVSLVQSHFDEKTKERFLSNHN